MPRKRDKSRSKTAGKKKAGTHNPVDAQEAGPLDNVVDIKDKMVEKLGEEIRGLSCVLTDHLDEQVAKIVDLYQRWEQAYPRAALKNHHKLEMIRWGFVGPGGFERCHDDDRLPTDAFIGADDRISKEIARDHDAAKVIMCPAMESGQCQGVWSAMQMPPCYLLLLEVHHGLGGGALDASVQEVVDDYGCWGGPEGYAKNFEYAKELIKDFRDE